MVEHDVMIATKVAMLEHLVRDILIHQFKSMPDPLTNAIVYAETRGQLKPGAQIEPDLEPIRQAVWEQFLGSVVAGVRRAQER